MSDPRRSKPITILWDGTIGRLFIDDESWGAIEWSDRRQAWCIEDAEGRCLRHKGSIRGQATVKDAAIALAEAMIRDGRMPSPEQAKQEHRERRAKQARTRPVSIRRIVASREFERGLDEVRDGVPFNPDNDDWNYERGRCFGFIAPLEMPLRIGSDLNPKALKLAEAAFSRKLLI
jgi:hypothetical protein